MASKEDLDLDDLCDLLENDVEPANGQTEEKNERDDLKSQMEEMQQQMKMLQEKLAAAESKSRKLEEADIFSKSGASANAKKSPVKTNPFTEVKVTDKLTKMTESTSRFGPSLPNKTPTRKIVGVEKRQLIASLREKDSEEKGMAMKVAQDLHDSDDDDDDVNEFGRGVRRQLKEERRAKDTGNTSEFSDLRGGYINLSSSSSNKKLPGKILFESHSRLRIANALLDQTSLDLKLVGRKVIPVHRLKNEVPKDTDDWVTFGVIFHKNTNTSKNGNVYTIWRISDLQSGAGSEFKKISVFLFGRAHSKHYSMPMNKVVGILNAKNLQDRSGKGEVSISIDDPDKILEMGDSMDVGKCKGKRQDGTGCQSLVNKNVCEYCAFHIKKAYNSLSSKRGDLQSSFSGNSGVRDRIMNKIAPKGEVFAAGQILNTNGIKGKVSARQKDKDSKALSRLGVTMPSQKVLTNNIAQKRQILHHKLLNDDSTIGLEKVGKGVIQKAVKKVQSEDLGLKLLNPSPGSRQLMRHLVNEELPKEVVKQSQLLTREEEMVYQRKRMADNQKLAKEMIFERKSLEKKKPVLGRGLKGGDGFIDISGPSSSSPLPLDRTRALAILKGKEIKKLDPNYVMNRKRSRDQMEESEKRVNRALTAEDDKTDDDGGAAEKEEKRQKIVNAFTGEVIDEEKMAKLRAKQSSKSHLADEHEVEEEDRYFDKLAKKEDMEEKMIATKEITSKVVTCAACNYTSFSQSELCRNMGHNVKVMQAKKRFFQCKNCKKRTFAFDKYPKHSCSNCGGSSWERTGMMRERRGPVLDSEKLLIRGREQKFIGAHVASNQLNLDSI